jgi:hypothetical protein
MARSKIRSFPVSRSASSGQGGVCKLATFDAALPADLRFRRGAQATPNRSKRGWRLPTFAWAWGRSVSVSKPKVGRPVDALITKSSWTLTVPSRSPTTTSKTLDSFSEILTISRGSGTKNAEYELLRGGHYGMSTLHVIGRSPLGWRARGHRRRLRHACSDSEPVCTPGPGQLREWDVPRHPGIPPGPGYTLRPWCTPRPGCTVSEGAYLRRPPFQKV